MTPNLPSPPLARDAVRALRASRIRDVANAGMGRPDVMPFWFGEPDEVTPEFIRRAAIEALERGDTFYTQNLGIPELREALAAYVTGLRSPTRAGRIVVTNSGMSALALTMQALLDPGDRVVALTPSWPNLIEGPKILGAEVSTVSLGFDARGWSLDLQRLLDAIGPGTRMVIVNSPNNPTGWTLAVHERDAILAQCRQVGAWLVSDDAYERLYYGDGRCAPGFLDTADPADRVISVNTFSKSWLMTGWRLGWVVAPDTLIPELGKLVEYNTSCAPGFVQHAGVAALTHGEAVVDRTRDRFRGARDFLVRRLSAIPGVQVSTPPGAMYVFFRIAGLTDSFALCKALVERAGLGLAPGIAFGPEGEGFLRWCFAAAEDRLEAGAGRLSRHLARDPR
jgi:aspartate/methionine/tyrosine aminotransferase